MTPKFIQPTFIRKNTPELRKKLVDLGYTILFSARYCCCNGICAQYGLVSAYKLPSWGKDIIDCGDNEDLFLALAALREDSDKFQWFVYKDSWICSLMDNWIHRLPYHKATPAELIKHFKGN